MVKPEWIRLVAWKVVFLASDYCLCLIRVSITDGSARVLTSPMLSTLPVAILVSILRIILPLLRPQMSVDKSKGQGFWHECPSLSFNPIT